MTTPLLDVTGLTVTFASREGTRVPAVSDARLTVAAGRTLAIVGESGSGKTVTALAIIGLLPGSGRLESGRIMLDGRDLLTRTPRDRAGLRGRTIGMIFQDPMTSLNPVFTIGDQLVQTIRRHRRVSSRDARSLAIEALVAVGIDRPRRRLRSCPHELSGGMCQRVMIALATLGRPRLLLADEPTTALDVTTQARVLDLLDARRDEDDMGLVLISHDLGLVARHAHTACVMYAGRILEQAPASELLRRPLHPYTAALLACTPHPRLRRSRLPSISAAMRGIDHVPPVETSTGFVRPWWPVPGDSGDPPVLAPVGEDRWVACHSPG